MTLDSAFANRFGGPTITGVLGAPVQTPQPPSFGVLATPQDAAASVGGVLGYPGAAPSSAGAPFDALQSLGGGQPPAANALGLFAAQMRALQSVRDSISDPQTLARFDADPLGYATAASSGQGEASTAAAGRRAMQPPATRGVLVAPTLGIDAPGRFAPGHHGQASRPHDQVRRR